MARTKAEIMSDTDFKVLQGIFHCGGISTAVDLAEMNVLPYDNKQKAAGGISTYFGRNTREGRLERLGGRPASFEITEKGLRDMLKYVSCRMADNISLGHVATMLDLHALGE